MASAWQRPTYAEDKRGHPTSITGFRSGGDRPVSRTKRTSKCSVNSRLAHRDMGACPWRIRKSRRDRHLEQAVAKAPPDVAHKDGRGGWRFARLFSWSTAIERLVSAMVVVISSELFQLSPQVARVPDQHVVSIRLRSRSRLHLAISRFVYINRFDAFLHRHSLRKFDSDAKQGFHKLVGQRSAL